MLELPIGGEVVLRHATRQDRNVRFIQHRQSDHDISSDQPWRANRKRIACRYKAWFRYVGKVFIIAISSLMNAFVHGQVLTQGPSPCPDGNGEGYTDLATLQSDLDIAFSDSQGQQGGLYRLCPNTIFSFGATASVPASTTRSGINLQKQSKVENEDVVFKNRSPQIATSFGYEPWEAKIENHNPSERRLSTYNTTGQKRAVVLDDIREDRSSSFHPLARSLQDFLAPSKLDVPIVGLDDFENDENYEDENDIKDEIYMMQSESAFTLLSMLGAEDWDDSQDIEMFMDLADVSEDHYFYSSANVLQNGMTMRGFNDGFFRQSTTEILSPLVILSSNTIIQCGDDGLAENGCIFTGGGNQIVVGQDAAPVLIAGITFEEAIDVNVVSSGTQASSVTLSGCLWRRNIGPSSVMIVFFEDVTPVPTPAPTQSDNAPVATPIAPAAPTAPVVPTIPPVSIPSPVLPTVPTPTLPTLPPGNVPSTPVLPTVPTPTLPTLAPAPSAELPTTAPAPSVPSAPSINIPTLPPAPSNVVPSAPSEPSLPSVPSISEPSVVTTSPTSLAPTTIDERVDVDDIFRFDFNVDDIFSPRQIGADDDVVPPPLAPSSSVTVTESTFENNSNELGVIANFGGQLDVEKTYFQQNEVSGSLIFAQQGSVGIGTSCFLGNSLLTLPGLAFVEEATQDRNDLNFHQNNTGQFLTCNGIFDALTGACAIFDAQECQIDISNTTAPSLAPSMAPTANVTEFLETIPPSQSPSFGPTAVNETATPSSSPTSSPPSPPTVPTATIQPTIRPTIRPSPRPTKADFEPTATPTFDFFPTETPLSMDYYKPWSMKPKPSSDWNPGSSKRGSGWRPHNSKPNSGWRPNSSKRGSGWRPSSSNRGSGSWSRSNNSKKTSDDSWDIRKGSKSKHSSHSHKRKGKKKKKKKHKHSSKSKSKKKGKKHKKGKKSWSSSWSSKSKKSKSYKNKKGSSSSTGRKWGWKNSSSSTWQSKSKKSTSSKNKSSSAKTWGSSSRVSKMSKNSNSKTGKWQSSSTEKSNKSTWKSMSRSKGSRWTHESEKKKQSSRDFAWKSGIKSKGSWKGSHTRKNAIRRLRKRIADGEIPLYR